MFFIFTTKEHFPICPYSFDLCCSALPLITLLNIYGLLTKRQLNMAGYSFFFACLWTETKLKSINTQKRNEANIQPS